MEPVRSLISLDIGGTLGNAQGPGLAAHLAAASPLGPQQARRIMRDVLHTAPEITDAVVDRVCRALSIEPSAFPETFRWPRSCCSRGRSTRCRNSAGRRPS